MTRSIEYKTRCTERDLWLQTAFAFGQQLYTRGALGIDVGKITLTRGNTATTPIDAAVYVAIRHLPGLLTADLAKL